MFSKGPDSPEYAAAKDKLNSFVINSQQMERAVNNMTSKIKSFASFFTQFGSKILAQWLPDAPPAVAQADEVAQKNAATFETLVDTFQNQLAPQFYNLLTTHDAHVKELQQLDKKRCNLLRDMEKKEQTLKSHQNAKEPQEARIQQAQVQLDQAKQLFEEANTQFLEQIRAFDEKRNVTLLGAFQNFMGMFCQLINQASLLQPIDFPADINAETVAIPEVKPIVTVKPTSDSDSKETPSQTSEPAPSQQPYDQQPTQAATELEEKPEEPIPEEPYNPPAPEPAEVPTYDNSYNNNTYNDTSNNDNPYNDASNNNDTSNNNNSYNDTSYNQQSYNEPAAQPNTTPSYAYDAPQDTNDNQQNANDEHPAKNPFDEDDDGWGANPFG